MILTSAPICDVPHTLSQMRTAIGGDRWNRLAQTTASGSVVVSGLAGRARFDRDLRGVRYAQRFHVAAMGSSAEIYDGTTVWAKDISGGVHAYDTQFPRERARTDAFIGSLAYLDPKSGASYRCTAAIHKNGDGVTVIRVQPRGGISADLAVDRRTHLLESVTERFPITTRVTHYSDYRTVDGVVLPFTITQGDRTDPQGDFRFQVQHYELAARAEASRFARPLPDRNVTMIDGSTSSTIPMTLEGRQLLVWASIDGHAPMPFILDTGGHAILTTGAAKTLGLTGKGGGQSGGAGAHTIATQYTRVKTLRLGNAELRDQPMLVIDYPYAFYERGKREPLAGILGLEIFEHFATRIDYGRRTVTLSPYSTFAYHGRGTPVPVRFQDDMPMIQAAVDGQKGMFGTDTGNAAVLILFGGFLQRTGLNNAYPGGDVVVGHGTGGQNTGRLVTLRTYTIGGHALHDVPADFTHMTSGSFSSWTEAGNVGYEVLSRFVPTFDYASETLYLDRCTRECVPPKNFTGMGIVKDSPTEFTVTSIAKDSSAARNGIAAGDRIIQVNGKPAADLSRADLWALMIRPDLPLRLEIQSNAGSTVRIIILRPVR